MSDAAEVQRAIKQAERSLLRWGKDLRFQLAPEGQLQVVRRLLHQGDRTQFHYQFVTNLEAADPAVWEVAHPEGAFTLGGPYPQRRQRCALSGRTFESSAPVALYYKGRPVCSEMVAPEAPLLALLYDILASMTAAATYAYGAQLTPAATRSYVRRLFLNTLVEELAKDPEAKPSRRRKDDDEPS